MRVAKRMHEVSGLVSRHLRNHHREQGVRSDVERDTKKHIGRTLIELAREPAVGDIKLKQAMAWRQRHFVDISRIPGGDNQTARIWIALDHSDDVADLINGLPVPRRP